MILWIILLLPTITIVLSKDDYRYFDFVRQWAPNVCYKSSHICKHLPSTISTWTIHGLWPTLDPTHYPSNCGTCHFSAAAIADIAPEMHDKWPTDYKGGDTKFWSHEYCKHGTCCTDVLTSERDYFGQALTLHGELELEEALSGAGIEASEDQSYTLEQLEDAIETKFGVQRAHYWCRFIKENRHGHAKQLMYQLSVCVDKSLQAINCPEQPKHSCVRDKPFYLLPFSVLNTTD